MRTVRLIVPLLAALATTAAVPAPAGASEAPVVLRATNYAVFSGLLQYGNGGYHADTCYEIDTSGRVGLTCEFSFAITSGGLSCDGTGRPETEGKADYRSNLLGLTFAGTPITGITQNGSPHMRGSIIGFGGGGPRLLNIDIDLASLCTGEREKTFSGVVTYV